MVDKAVVLLSGGMDSTVCLFWALEQFEEVHTVAFDYGQLHKVELRCAREVAREADTPHTLLPIAALKVLGGTALTDREVKIEAGGGQNVYAEARSLPSTFVPGRNLLFLTLAAAYGAKVGALNLVTGVCAADEAGYPDCRPEFIGTAQSALSQALGTRVTVYTPLILRTKAQTWALADELGVLSLVKEDTHTCYGGDHKTRNTWGYGCGECVACKERSVGYYTYLANVMGPHA